MGRTKLCKKNCKYEYKEIEYQLKKEKEKKKETWYLQPWKRKSNTNLYIVICQKINENNHIKLSYNLKCKEKEEQHMVHTYQS